MYIITSIYIILPHYILGFGHGSWNSYLLFTIPRCYFSINKQVISYYRLTVFRFSILITLDIAYKLVKILATALVSTTTGIINDIEIYCAF